MRLSQGCNGSCASHSGLTALAVAIQVRDFAEFLQQKQQQLTAKN
jgi:hypothetical protein